MVHRRIFQAIQNSERKPATNCAKRKLRHNRAGGKKMSEETDEIGEINPEDDEEGIDDFPNHEEEAEE
jgi:hypothetical protein